MADFDVFDMVGLAFDPPETNARQVKKKIDQKKAELGSTLGRETQQTNRDALQAQIDYLDGIAIQILSPDGKKLIDSAFKPLADRKTAAELSSLSATVELLAITGEHTVTEATIRHYKKESRLSVEHVKKAFTDAGLIKTRLRLSRSFLLMRIAFTPSLLPSEERKILIRMARIPLLLTTFILLRPIYLTIRKTLLCIRQWTRKNYE